MTENSKIAWCHHTFNPWMGCTKVSEGCRSCYAQALVEGRMGKRAWGNAPRIRTKGPWRDVLRWNREAEESGVRRRLFCASLADVFEDAPGLDVIRAELWPLIDACFALDWLLLTKRPENIRRMVPAAWLEAPRSHVWLGTSCEDQCTADERIPLLLQTPAAVRFLSCEPLLGPIDLRPWLSDNDGCEDCENGAACKSCPTARAVFVDGPYDIEKRDTCWTKRATVDWVIAGGESGPGHRPMQIEWARSLLEQCRDAGVAFFFKQVGGARPGTGEDALGEIVQEFPRAAAEVR